MILPAVVMYPSQAVVMYPSQAVVLIQDGLYCYKHDAATSNELWQQ
jgi:hypothetical protein